MSDFVSHDDQVDWINDIDWTLFPDLDIDRTLLPDLDWACVEDVAQESTNPAATSYWVPRQPSVQIPERVVYPTEQSFSTTRDFAIDDSTESSAPSSSRCTELVQRRRKGRQRVACDEIGCGRSFDRKYELDRHIATAHKKEKPYYCTISGCLKGLSAPVFARSDKLTAHIRAAHSFDDGATCPAPGCEKVTLPLDLLGAHIWTSHNYEVVYSSQNQLAGHLRALLNAADTEYRKCPYWRCGRRLKLSSLVDHILSHNAVDIDEMESVLIRHFYFPVRQDPSQKEQGGTEHNSSCRATGVLITCPICNHFCEDTDAFVQHLVVGHLVRQEPDQLAHFQTWCRMAEPLFSEYRWEHNPERVAWKSWDLKAFWTTCSACQKTLGPDPRPAANMHHLSLLRPVSELGDIYPPRREILRLCPAFRSHPIFEDLRTETIPEI